MIDSLAAIRVNSSVPWLLIGLALAILIPLAWRSWRGAPASPGATYAALAARLLGIVLLVFALADLQLISERPQRGANVVALLVDNSLGMNIRDEPTGPSRAEALLESVEGIDSQWFSKLGEEYQIRGYGFDERLRRVSRFQSLSFDGERSDLFMALTDARDRLDALPVAGIVVFTDGNATDASLLSDAALADFPPIYPILVGSESRLPDLAINAVSVAQSAFDDSPLTLRANVSSYSESDSETELSLSRIVRGRADETLEDVELKREKFAAGDRSASVRFEWSPSEPGTQFYRLETRRIANSDTPESEATLVNNSRLFATNGQKSRYRILYLTGRPNWEYKFLNRALANDPQLDLVALIRVAQREPKFEFKGRAGESANPLYRGFGREDEIERFDESVLIRMNTRDAEELRTGFPNDADTLFSYDAVIIDDLEANFFTFNQQTLLRDFAKQRGGGLLLLGGANALNDGGYQDSQLEQALPLYLDRGEPAIEADRSVSWDLTREGWVEPWIRIHPTETDERLRIDSMPRLKVSHALSALKPGARTLATIEDVRGEVYPALVTRNFGSGRVAVVSVGDFWRWGMKGNAENEDLAKFWRQIARWLVTDTPRQVELAADTNGPEGVALTAIARGKDFRPLELGTARLTVRQVASAGHSENSEPLEIELPMRAVPNRPGHFSASLPIQQSGAYLAQVQVTDSQSLPVGEAETGWVAEPLVAEFASITPNRNLLEKIASATGGRVLDLGQAASLADELQKRDAPFTESYAQPLWHNAWLFALALGCFLVEWLLRRRKGLP